MLTAINAIKLLLLISLGFLYLIGQGWLIIGPLLHGSLFNRKKEISRSLEMSLLLISGVIINYGLTIIVQSLQTSLIIGGILSLVGLFFFIFTFIKSFKQITVSVNSFYKWLGIILVSSLFLGPILVIPLWEWDALSIWFLHAKMIYMAGSFSQLTGWLHPSVLFSHVDYPNLVPALAAQITHLMGFWNEYLPKLSMFFLLVPAVILLFSSFRRSYSFLFLIILIPFSFASRLWDGYMDGYLSLFFALSMLFLGKYYKDVKPINLFLSIACLSLLLYIKNEGVLAVVAGIIAISFTLLFKHGKFSLKRILRDNWKYFVFFILLCIPFFIWSNYKRQWGINNDLELGTNQSIIRMIERINDGSYKSILDNTNFELKSGIMLLGILFFVSLAVKNKIPKEILPVMIGAVIYCLGIMFVYLVTPYDLAWHLHQSVYRTLLSVNTCIYIASYFLVSSLEKNEVV